MAFVREQQVSDKIQNILKRLDLGEELIGGRLRKGDQFCIMGLFAEESGLVNWELSHYGYYRAVTELSNIKMVADLPAELVSYYNLINAEGRFDIDDIPAEIKEMVMQHTPDALSLTTINDYGIRDKLDKNIINSVLAAVIRSGAIFKRDTNLRHLPT